MVSMSDTSEQSGASSSAGSNGKSEINAEDKDDHQISFASYQQFIYLATFGAYCILLYNRHAFTFTLPYILTERYFSSYEVGMIINAQAYSYAVSKFYCSWVTDHYSPRVMLTTGLFFSGFVMLALPDQEGWISMMLLAAANGVAQGLGWPAVAKIIRAWYPPSQFGFWFALLGAASNLMSAIGPNLASALSVNHGWRTAIYIPALLAIAGSPAIMACTWDKPSDVGYEDQMTLGGAEKGHWSDLVGSDFMMVLISTFSFLFIVKTSCSDWGQTYLTEERGVPYSFTTGFFTSLEMGGFTGTLLLGAITDFMVRKRYHYGRGKTPRMLLVQFSTAGSCLFLNVFLFGADPETSKSFVTWMGFCMGFWLYGAISLIGTVAVEVAPIHLTGAAHAIVGLSANIAIVLAGTPLHFISETWSWSIAFISVSIMCLAAFFIVIIGKDLPATFLEQHSGGPPRLYPNKDVKSRL